VITRQPAAEKRLTVAWPIPRLAPVRSNVRRGWFVCGLGMPFLKWFYSVIDKSMLAYG
jgi:hypothetical protein